MFLRGTAGIALGPRDPRELAFPVLSLGFRDSEIRMWRIKSVRVSSYRNVVPFYICRTEVILRLGWTASEPVRYEEFIPL